MSRKYILDGKNPVEVEDIFEWGRWMEIADRRVARQIINGGDISTVFLGLDHSFGQGPPMLFETMIFGGEYDQEIERYSTWKEAEAGHRRWVERLATTHPATEEESR